MADLDGIIANKDKDYGIGIPVQKAILLFKRTDIVTGELKTE